MAHHSDSTQLATLDAVTAALRRGMLPPKKDCVMLADVLGTIRDRVARAKLADERRREKSRPDTSRDLSQAMYQDINRGR